jgi:hypothetical protein
MAGEKDLLDLGDDDLEVGAEHGKLIGQGMALAVRFVDALEQIADSYARSVDVGIERQKTQDAAMAQFMAIAKRHLGGG